MEEFDGSSRDGRSSRKAVQEKLDVGAIGLYNASSTPIKTGDAGWLAETPPFLQLRRPCDLPMNAIRPSYCGMARRSSTQTRQFAIGRFDMLGILEMPSVVNFPQPLPRNPRCGAQPMRLGMTLPNPVNSLFRQMNSLFGPKNSLLSFEQGIWLQAVDPALNLCADRMPRPAKTSRNLTNSLLISLLSGKVRPSSVGTRPRPSPRALLSLLPRRRALSGA